MKRIMLFGFFLAFTVFANAQVKGILDRAKQRAIDKKNQKVNTTTDNAVDSVFSKTEKGAKNVITGKTDSTGKNEKKPGAETSNKSINDENPLVTEDKKNNQSPDIAVYKKFDFVPGEKIIVIEDFSKDALGDFPDKWNTNSSGELVTIEGQQGKWLMLQKEGLLLPEFITSLPENFTFEFELMCNKEFNFYSAPFYFIIAGLKTQANYTDWKQFFTAGRNGLEILLHPTNANASAGSSEYNSYVNGASALKNQVYTKQFHAATNNHVKVSVWRQKQRIRVYLNEEKVWDIPKALAATTQYNSILFAVGGSANTTGQYYLGNLKLAVGAPDTRNKLITEGKFITHGILFDVNSDDIKPQSYGALKDIANVLKENPDINVKIVGHTDSDGDENSNLALSKRRAEAVKVILNKEFGIELSKMETDGKGEGQPVDKNLTAVGKANNRRVEFIKF